MKIAVGGMIASGKSTLVKQLSKHLKYYAIDEFREDDDVFNQLLEWLYQGREDVEMLLQIYFLHKHWKVQKDYPYEIVVDRHMIEHWLFAQHNIKDPTILNFYNSVYYNYMSDVKQPDLYIILDMNWDSFYQRVHKRGRDQELKNFERNEDYFRGLIKNYTKKLEAQCQIHDIDYVIISTDGLTTDEVLKITKQKIYEWRKNNETN